MTEKLKPPAPPLAGPPPPPAEADRIDAWIERRLAAIREDRERMREMTRADPWIGFRPPF